MGKLVLPFIGVVLGLLKLSSTVEFHCQETNMKYNSTQWDTLKECLDYHGKASIWKLKSEDFPCFGKCMMESRGFIAEDGESLVLERVMEYIEMVAPDDAKDKLKKMLAVCVTEHGNKIRAKHDKTCMTFMEVGQCFMGAFLDGCIAD